MDNVKSSLEENMDEILKNLPEEFHADFKAQVAEAAPAPQLSGDEVVAAINAEMKDNPAVENAVADELTPEPPAAPEKAPASESEQAELLKEAEAMGPNTEDDSASA